MKLIVRTTRLVADGVVHLHLGAADGLRLPPFRAGAHLKFMLPGTANGRTREYSLIGRGEGRDGYEVAVLLDPQGRGGSRAMHALTVGDSIDAEGPFNEFPLSDTAANHVLIAGGIGITPILSMARELLETGAKFKLHYAAKSRRRMPFHDDVAVLPNAVLHFSDELEGARMPIQPILGSPARDKHVYVCGPASLIADVVETARRLNWCDDQVHFEAFGGAVTLKGDKPIRLELRATGRTIVVKASESILDAMLNAGLDPLYDCRRGECGMCITPVIEGVPEHRDQTLTGAERASGKVICTCVSRALTADLTLDF